MTPSEDVKDLLVAESDLALTYATNLYIGRMPAEPRNCVVIFDTPGFPSDQSLDRSRYERPSIQIRVRHSSYLLGMAQAISIADFLEDVGHVTVNGALYHLIKCSQRPFCLEWDTQGNCHIVATFDIQRTI